MTDKKDLELATIIRQHIDIVGQAARELEKRGYQVHLRDGMEGTSFWTFINLNMTDSACVSITKEIKL